MCMVRTLLIMTCVMWMSGCKNQTPSVDPFFGRTTVPPPSTGAASPTAANAYPGQTTQPSLQTGSSYNNNSSGNLMTNSQPSANPPGVVSYSNQNASQKNQSGASTMNNQPPVGYGAQPTRNQPVSTPSGSAPTMLPPGIQNVPGTYNNNNNDNNNNNYRGTTDFSRGMNQSTSQNKISTPYYPGGQPNRSTMLMVDNNSQTTNVNNTQTNGNMFPVSRQNRGTSQALPSANYQDSIWRESASSNE